MFRLTSLTIPFTQEESNYCSTLISAEDELQVINYALDEPT